MANRKSKPELVAENKFLRKRLNTMTLARVTETAIRMGTLVAIAGFAYLSVKALAGETTAADIGIKVLTDFKISEALAWLFGGSGLAYGLRERKLRRETVEREHSRIQKLEKQLDPRRKSSE